jgi:hypothetical protein
MTLANDALKSLPKEVDRQTEHAMQGACLIQAMCKDELRLFHLIQI